MDAEVFGAFVQKRRKELGLSQAELAEKLHVTAKAVSRWERGVGFPDIKLLEPLAKALDITIVELMQSRLIETDIPKENAAALVSDTVSSLQSQEAAARQKKVVLTLGTLLIGGVASFLYCLGLYYEFEPRWIGMVMRWIALLGGVGSQRALKYIIENHWTPPKESVWYKWQTWASVGVAVLGFGLLVLAVGFLDRDSIWCYLAIGAGFVMMMPGSAHIYQFLYSR